MFLYGSEFQRLNGVDVFCRRLMFFGGCDFRGTSEVSEGGLGGSLLSF